MQYEIARQGEAFRMPRDRTCRSGSFNKLAFLYPHQVAGLATAFGVSEMRTGRSIFWGWGVRKTDITGPVTY
jgi:hypothetical protein